MSLRVLARHFGLVLAIGVCPLISVPAAVADGWQTVGTGTAGRPGTGSIEGQVIDGTTGAPVSGATVTLPPPIGTNRPPVGRPAVTDPTGHFLITDLASGRVIVRADAPNYVPGWNGAFRPDDTSQSFAVTGDQRVDHVVVRMWKAGAIEGRVVDDAGIAVLGASVEVRRRKARGFGAEYDILKQGTTDAAGRYSVTGLWPADYIVVVLSTAVSLPTSVVAAYQSALRGGGDQSRALIETLRATRVPIPLNPVTFGSSTLDLFGPDGPAPRPASAGDGRLVTFQTTFYPAAVTVHDAAPIQVGPGQVRSDIDFHLTRRRWVRVAGTVTGPNSPAPYVGLRLVQPDDVPAEASEFTFPFQYDNAETITDEQGRFEFLGVSAGRYQLKAAPGNRTPWLQADVTVGDADILDLHVALRAGIRVSGRIVFDGGTAPTSDMLTRATVARLGEVLPTGYAPPPGATPGADGSFTTPGYPPGRYLVLPQSAIPGWSLRSAVLGGRDVTLLPFTLVESDVNDLVLTYTRQIPFLVGTVRANSTLEPAETEVVVFPADFETWLKEGMPSHLPSRQTRVTHVAADGTFLVPLLAPGDYLAAALDAREAGDRSADTFRRLARVATRVTLPASGLTTLELVPVTIR